MTKLLTVKQKGEISKLRVEGCSYGIIVQRIGCKDTQVASYCRRNGLGVSVLPANASSTIGVCKTCGGLIHGRPTGRKRVYCSTKCKDKYWSINKDKLRTNQNRIHKCLGCGEFFAPASDKRKYCSMQCYVNTR